MQELNVTSESNRKNQFISSLLFSRATIFHPSDRLTLYMKNKMIQVAESGGVDPENPLESVDINSYGKRFRVDLHVNYLLQPHRDILETIMAYGQHIQLSDEAYDNGQSLKWSDIFNTIESGALPESVSDSYDSILDRNCSVFSMSLYELAKRIGLKPERSTYDNIEKRILQLSTTQLMINEIDDDGVIFNSKPLKFIQDFRFYCDLSKHLNKNYSSHKRTNHVFIVPDSRLVKAIRDHGFLYRLEQEKLLHYKKPSVRSFLTYLRTHNSSYIHKKTIDWVLKNYAQSIAARTGRTFLYDLKKELLSKAVLIEQDFRYQIINDGNEYFFYYVGDD